MSHKVAIVGFAHRLPGMESGDLWSRLSEGRDLVTRLPADRWALDTSFHPSKSQPGTSYSPRAGNIGDVSRFDTTCFGSSPREAEQLDPQQRLLFEMSWEAFKSGGIAASSVRQQKGGVFIGFSGSDWSYRRADDLSSLDAPQRWDRLVVSRTTGFPTLSRPNWVGRCGMPPARHHWRPFVWPAVP